MTETVPTNLTLRVTRKEEIARDIWLFELRDPGNAALPEFTAGAHVSLHLSNGLIRKYSLCNDPAERDRYLVAVKRETPSRGGSVALIDSVGLGDALPVDPPVNDFPLPARATDFLFIAGGIGITPILSMIHHCQAHGLDWRLLYLARGREHAAFHERIVSLGGNRVRFHFDAEAGRLFEFTASSLGIEPGVHIYCCGPGPMMRAVESFAAAHPQNPARFEWFKAPETEIAPSPRVDFTVKLSRSGRILQVPEDKSILQVLEESGIDWPCSCREGMCRTCEAQVIEGVPDHRDYVLSESERAAGKSMMICVSRAKTPSITLEA
jgi:tetrachlorobenzoquinone reductase